MGYSFTDLGAEGCRRSLNALFVILFVGIHAFLFVYEKNKKAVALEVPAADPG